jgi:hypothetical protein
MEHIHAVTICRARATLMMQLRAFSSWNAWMIHGQIQRNRNNKATKKIGYNLCRTAFKGWMVWKVEKSTKLDASARNRLVSVTHRFPDL